MTPKQAFLSEEMEPKRIPEVEAAAENLHEIRTKRIKLNEEEDGAQALLVQVMEKHHLDAYKFETLMVTIEQGKTKAKVKEIEAEDPPKEDH